MAKQFCSLENLVIRGSDLPAGDRYLRPFLDERSKDLKVDWLKPLSNKPCSDLC